MILAHELAEILLQGENSPVTVPSMLKEFDAELVEHIFILQNDDSPFEYSILLEGGSFTKNTLIEVKY